MERVAVSLKVLHSAGVTCGVCCCQSEGVAQCRGDLWSVLLSV